MQQELYQALLNKEDLDWKNLLTHLVETEQMNPWDIDVTILTQRYIEMIRQLKETDLRISGKVLLAAALLLKIKSTYLLEHDISNLDRLLAQTEEGFEEDLIEQWDAQANGGKVDTKHWKLLPRQPQPRNRKVSLPELITALQRAMETKRRSLQREAPVPLSIPIKKFDIMQLIGDVYHRITNTLRGKSAPNVTFTELLPSQKKEDKILTFLPLLHLETEGKIETEQAQHFGEITIRLAKNGKEK